MKVNKSCEYCGELFNGPSQQRFCRRSCSSKHYYHSPDGKYREWVLRYSAARYKSNPRIAIHCRISQGVSHSISVKKPGKTFDLLPYDINELMERLELQFVDGMSWSNRDRWHIDHIIPVRYFNYPNPGTSEFEQCWALSNLQPLWAADNLKKNDFLPDGTRARDLRKDSNDTKTTNT